MDLKDRLVLGRRDHNVAQPAAPAAAKQGRPTKKSEATSEDQLTRVDFSDDEEYGQKKGVMRLTKATQLVALTRRVRETTDNVALAGVVRDFTEVLDSSRSRTLTKEGFAFLDALYKQLADPSVYVVPIRTSRRQVSLQQENKSEGDARRAKVNKLITLRQDVVKAKSNKQLANIVLDFGATIDKAKARTVTKDSIMFLDHLTATIRSLS
jgi:casein kinase 1